MEQLDLKQKSIIGCLLIVLFLILSFGLIPYFNINQSNELPTIALPPPKFAPVDLHVNMTEYSDFQSIYTSQCHKHKHASHHRYTTHLLHTINSFPLPKLIQSVPDHQSSLEILGSYDYDVEILQSKQLPHFTHSISNNILHHFCHQLSSSYHYSSSNSTHETKSIRIFLISEKLEEFISNIHEFQTKNITLIHGSYILHFLSNHHIHIYLQDLDGLRYSLQTLSQILYYPSQLQLPLEVIDWPSNQWRGLMIDIARHFIPIKLLKRTIDGMELSKLNKLHLHLTDATSFPIQFTQENTLDGQLLQKIFTPETKHNLTKQYTEEELMDLVAYATSHGVEIIPEIDIPAHVYSWGKSFHQLIVPCHEYAHTTSKPQDIYLLDISNPQIYHILQLIFQRIHKIFPSTYIHLGGDEINVQCWLNNTKFSSWMHENHLTSHNITMYFEEKIITMLEKQFNKTVILWQDIQDDQQIPLRNTHRETEKTYLHPAPNSPTSHSPHIHSNNTNNRHYHERHSRLLLPASSPATQDSTSSSPSSSSSAVPPTSNSHNQLVIESWKCWGGLSLRSSITAIENNRYSLMSGCWYLDFDSDWISYLAINIANTAKKQSPPSAYNYFLGGEAALWTEHVDHCNYECRLWPRTGSIAYNLWGLGPSLLQYSANQSSYIENKIDMLTLTYPLQLTLDNQTYSYLTLCYAIYRQILFDTLLITASPLTFHYPKMLSFGSMISYIYNPIVPRTFLQTLE